MNTTLNTAAKQDFAGAYDEAELVELSHSDAAGGAAPASWTVTVPISLAVCPTTECTSAC